jgi:hypothetical protein
MSRSWFREWRARARPTAERLEQGVEARTVLSWQAALTWQESQSATLLINALAATSDAVVRIGSILLVKQGGVVYCNNLTLEQVHKLEHEPELIQDPGGILAALGLPSERTERVDTTQLPG